MTRIKLVSAQTAAAFVLAGTAVLQEACAQMFDYGALETLFGEPVTTSATGQPQRASDAPANMIIITADEIRRSGARDIPGVLRHIGGVDILEWTSGHTDVSVRGYNVAFSPRLLVLIDGRQVYADHYGFTPWNALPIRLEEIRQIEIVKGPNAALFGFNAVGGVINIVTFHPLKDDIDAASIMVGTQDLTGGGGVATLKLGSRAALRVSAGAQFSDDYSTPIPPALGLARTAEDERRTVRLDAVFKAADDVHVRFVATYSDSERAEIGPSVILLGTDYEITSFSGHVTADTKIGLIEATAYTNNVRAVTDPTFVLPGFDFDNRVSVFRLGDVFAIGPHTLRLAGEYRRNHVNTSPFPGGDISYSVASASAMWDWKIASDLSFANAVRIDRLALDRDGAAPSDYPFSNDDWRRTIDEVSFNSGLVWRLSSRDTLRFIVSRGAQLPSLTNFGSLLLVTPFFNFTGAPTIDPSTVSNYEVVWDRQLESIDAEVRASAFFQQTRDAINLAGSVFLSPSAIYLGPANIGDSSATGFELGFSGKVGQRWRWGLDYRAQAVDDDFLPPFDVAEPISNYEDTTPKHLVHARVGWNSERWEIDAFLRYQTKTFGVLQPPLAPGPVLVPINGYAALDGRIAYRLTDWATLSISGRNLGSADQAQTAGPEVQRSVLGALSIAY